MADRIWGHVTNVVDGDTFDVSVTRRHQDNEYEYNAEERIRIRNIDAAEIPTPEGYRQKHRLVNELLGEDVELCVYTRDVYDRLVCDVTRTSKLLKIPEHPPL